MDIAKRKQNETEFENWTVTPLGGRRYWFDVTGEMVAKHLYGDGELGHGGVQTRYT